MTAEEPIARRARYVGPLPEFAGVEGYALAAPRDRLGTMTWQFFAPGRILHCRTHDLKYIKDERPDGARREGRG